MPCHPTWDSGTIDLSQPSPHQPHQPHRLHARDAHPCADIPATRPSAPGAIRADLPATATTDVSRIGVAQRRSRLPEAPRDPPYPVAYPIRQRELPSTHSISICAAAHPAMRSVSAIHSTPHVVKLPMMKPMRVQDQHRWPELDASPWAWGHTDPAPHPHLAHLIRCIRRTWSS